MTAEVFGLVGAFAAAPRRILARDAARQGLILHRGTTRRTTHAVFGRRLLERLPDEATEGRVAAERAAGRTLMSENGFLARLSGDVGGGGGGQIRAVELIEASGLAADDFALLALFDAFEHPAEPFAFRDVALGRTYAGLLADGATWGAIARSVHRAGTAPALSARALTAGAGAIYAEGGLAELDGQLLFGFAEEAPDPEDLFDAAEAAEARGDCAGAAALYARCLALDPTDAIAAYNRANCLCAVGRQEDAEVEFLRALRHDPALVEAWFNLAALVSRRGDAAAARRHLERAIAADPDYADAIFNLAAIAFESGDHATAARCWRRYLELDPGSGWARRAERGLRYLASHAAATG